MAHVTDDRIMETTTTTGTGALTLAGAVAGFRAFSAKMTSPSDTCFYMIEAVDVNGIPTGDFETGLGTYSAASTLTRTTVSRSSNADAIVTLVAGTKRVAIVDIASTAFTATTAPIVPIVGQVNIGTRTWGNFSGLAMRAAQGTERLVQPHIGKTKILSRHGIIYGGLLNVGLNGPSTQGANNAVFLGNTNMLTRAHRTQYVTTATAGTTTGFSSQVGLYYMGNGSGAGGFTTFCSFGVTDAAAVTGARMFVGLSSSTINGTNVNPATLLNVIGVAQVDGSTNLNIVFGGSTAQAPIDLGTNFPANTLSADLYNVVFFSDPNDNTKVGYYVGRFTSSNTPAFEASGTLTNTTPGTTFPAVGTQLLDKLQRWNNATALVASIDVERFVVVVD